VHSTTPSSRRCKGPTSGRTQSSCGCRHKSYWRFVPSHQRGRGAKAAKNNSEHTSRADRGFPAYSGPVSFLSGKSLGRLPSCKQSRLGLLLTTSFPQITTNHSPTINIPTVDRIWQSRCIAAPTDHGSETSTVCHRQVRRPLSLPRRRSRPVALWCFCSENMSQPHHDSIRRGQPGVSTPGTPPRR
jgi:hypothetical protein